jgi:phosphatidylinositol glycan class B
MMLVDHTGLRDPEWRRFVTLWLGLCLVLILVAAVQSDGYHHADEYFQNFEFAGAKLGQTGVQELPWEYAARMRGWLQPALYVAEARAWAALGVQDPFSWALGFRLTSGLLAWLATAGLALCAWRWLPSPVWRRAAVRALALAWFVPYLAVRTSSESLAGSCLALAVSLLALSLPEKAVAAAPPARLAMAGVGLLLGLAFELRFAVGAAVVGVLAWAIAVARVPVRRMLWAAAGLSAAVGLAALVDRWGYGAWTFPPYHYLFQNVVLDRAGRQFGTRPWYGYLVLATVHLAAPFILLPLAGAALGWIRRPLHLLTWASAPFFLAHCLIPHKELRFLFPVAAFAPVLLVLALAAAGDRSDRWRAPFWNARRGSFGHGVVALNLLALAAFSLVPTRPQIGFQHFVRQRYPTRFEAYALDCGSPWVAEGLNMHFYRPGTLRLHQISDPAEIRRRGQRHFLLITSWCATPPPRYACEALYRWPPCALRDLIGAHADRIPAWDLHDCVAAARP